MRGVFALFNWSLRLDVRSLGPHLLRLLFVFLLLASVIWGWFNSLTLSAPGLSLFRSICMMNVVLIVLGGIFYFSTTVTEEKESDSLSLLRLAGMGPLSILLGKFSSRLLGGLMLLMVQFPFTLLAITLGGVQFQQISAAYVALAGFLILVANIGLLASIRCHTSGNAAGLTGLLTILLLFIAPTVVQFSLAARKPAAVRAVGVGTALLADRPLRRAGRGVPQNPAAKSNDPWDIRVLESANDWLYETSVLNRIDVITQTGFNSEPVGTQFKAHVIAGFCLFVFCWLIFEPSVRDAGKPVRDALFKRTSPLRWLGVSRVWKRAPFAWKEFYFLAGGQTFFICKFVLYGIVTGLIWFIIRRAGSSRAQTDFGQTLSLLMVCALVLECCVYAARIYFDEIRWRALSSITLTPNSTARIAWAKVLGCAVAILPTLFWLGVATTFSSQTTKEFISQPATWFYVLQFATFLHFGALFSLYFRWGALPLAFIVTGVMHMCCPLLMLGFVLSDALVDNNGEFAFVGTLLGCIVHCIVFLLPLQVEIAHKLRRCASQ